MAQKLLSIAGARPLSPAVQRGAGDTFIHSYPRLTSVASTYAKQLPIGTLVTIDARFGGRQQAQKPSCQDVGFLCW